MALEPTRSRGRKHSRLGRAALGRRQNAVRRGQFTHLPPWLRTSGLGWSCYTWPRPCRSCRRQTAGRWRRDLAARADFAGDRVLPLMIWYGIEPAVPEDPARAVRLAESSPMLPLVRCIARRLTENLKLVPQPVEQLVTLAGQSDHTERTRRDSRRNGRGPARLAEGADAGERGSRHKKQDSSRVPIPKSAGSPANCRSSSATAGPWQT